MTYIFVTMLLLAASAIFSLYCQFYVLQQKSYYPISFLKWIIGSYSTNLAISTIVYCATMFFVLKDKGLFGLILAALFLVARISLAIIAHKNSTKKFALTTRIKRFYIIAILVLGVLLFVSSISFSDTINIVPFFGNYLIESNLFGEIVRTVCILLSCVTPLLAMVVWLVDFPIEIIILKLYHNKIGGEHTNSISQKHTDDSLTDETYDLNDDKGAEI